MQTNNETTPATVSTTEAKQPVPSIETVAAITTAEAEARAALAAKLQAKRQAANAKPASTTTAKRKPASANGKQAAKRIAAKPTAAKPTQAEREAKQRAEADSRRLARSLASAAVAAFYSGASKPFKAASDRFADLNPANAKAASVRQSALMLALITYGRGNMRSDGTFTRGAFVVPARLLDAKAPADATVRAQPESGCLGNMLGRTVSYVSGPRSGREQSAAVFKLNTKAALAEIQAHFGDRAAKAAAALLAKPAKPAKAA